MDLTQTMQEVSQVQAPAAAWLQPVGALLWQVTPLLMLGLLLSHVGRGRRFVRRVLKAW